MRFITLAVVLAIFAPAFPDGSAVAAGDPLQVQAPRAVRTVPLHPDDAPQSSPSISFPPPPLRPVQAAPAEPTTSAPAAGVEQSTQDDNGDNALATTEWLKKPSSKLAARLRHWRLDYVPGEPSQDVPENGMFRSWAAGRGVEAGTARIVTDLKNAKFKMKRVASQKEYFGAAYQDAQGNRATQQLLTALRNSKIAKFLDQHHINKAQLTIEKDLAMVFVQDFEAAWQVPGKRERVWSVYWRVEHQTEKSFDGYEAWGLFRLRSGVLEPFYLAASQTNVEVPGSGNLAALGVGDLDGDGIDELVVRQFGYEEETDLLEVWSWERGTPVLITNINQPPGQAFR